MLCNFELLSLIFCGLLFAYQIVWGRGASRQNFGKVMQWSLHGWLTNFFVDYLPWPWIITMMDVACEIIIYLPWAEPIQIICSVEWFLCGWSVMYWYKCNLFFFFCLRGGRYTEEDAKTIIVQILCVVAFCHLQGVVHRDLKPEVFFHELDVLLFHVNSLALSFIITRWCHWWWGLIVFMGNFHPILSRNWSSFVTEFPLHFEQWRYRYEAYWFWPLWLY